MMKPFPPSVERPCLLSIRDDLLEDTSLRLYVPALDDSTKKRTVLRCKMFRSDRVEVLERRGERVSSVASSSKILATHVHAIETTKQTTKTESKKILPSELVASVFQLPEDREEREESVLETQECRGRSSAHIAAFQLSHDSIMILSATRSSVSLWCSLSSFSDFQASKKVDFVRSADKTSHSRSRSSSEET